MTSLERVTKERDEVIERLNAIQADKKGFTESIKQFQKTAKELGGTDTFTKLVDKHYSPLIIRKYTHWGFPIYIALIADDDLTDLDHFIVTFMNGNKDTGWINNIQALRNLAGKLTEQLNDHYSSAEGVGVIFYVDKMFVSSLHGDFMNHTSCRIELYSLLTMSTGV